MKKLGVPLSFPDPYDSGLLSPKHFFLLASSFSFLGHLDLFLFPILCIALGYANFLEFSHFVFNVVFLLVYISKDFLVPLLELIFDVLYFLIEFEHPCPFLWLLLLPPLFDFFLESGVFDPKFLKSKGSILRCGLESCFQLD
jgi:hypothetical protein